MLSPETLAIAQKVVVSIMLGGQGMMAVLCLLSSKGWPALYWIAGVVITLAAGKMSGI